MSPNRLSPLYLVKFVLVTTILPFTLVGQEWGKPDRGQPGDAMIQDYLARRAVAADARFAEDLRSKDEAVKTRTRYKQEYLTMLGLWPVPEKTPLKTTVTGTIDRGDYLVDKLHFQSRPGLYVTGNLYRSKDPPKEKLPAILYVCGHADKGRNGNKAAYQSHGIWFARHGYVCLMLDSLQLGEIGATHHGTYRFGRWNWWSRGYTPAGVECWNGIRAIDYLQSRGDADPERIGVTGISGGGAATFWIAAADERVKVAVPVSGMADLVSYIPSRMINGHCDCMFLYNSFAWPWARIAGLIAPRPMMFVNSDNDPIFPMDANDRISNRLERLYSLYGASDVFDSFVSVGGHAYREDLRRGIYRFLNTHLKGDGRPVLDSEVDAVAQLSKEDVFPIPFEQLRVFPTDADLPKDQKNTTIDESFVPVATPQNVNQETYSAWREQKLTELRALPFRQIPNQVEPAVIVGARMGNTIELRTDDPIVCQLRFLQEKENPSRVVLIVKGPNSSGFDDTLKAATNQKDVVCELDVRGVGKTAWTTKSPPNYVERCHALVGMTPDTGRLIDIMATARYLHRQYPKAIIVAAGSEGSAVLAGYAALLEKEINDCWLVSPTTSHKQNDAPQFLSILRIADVPDVLLLTKDKIKLIKSTDDEFIKRVKSID